MTILTKNRPKSAFDLFMGAIESFGFGSAKTKTDQDEFYIRELKFAGTSKNKVLRYLREFHRLTQSDLAKELEISKSYVSELESGRKDVPSNILELYSSYFRIPMSHLYLLIESAEDQEDLPIMVEKAIKFLDWLSDEDEKKVVNKKI